MPKSNRNERRDWKAVSWDYDYIFSFSDEAQCPYYLTEREVQALLTFMETMGWTTRWESALDTPIVKDTIQALRDGIIDKLLRDEDCPADPCEDGCIDYLPNSGFIRYEPNDPFRSPELIPFGYTIPPWYTNPFIPLPGVIPTDAMVNQLAVFGPALPVSGFPRFSFEFDGRGEVEIELVNVPAGGFCLVVTDENLLNVKIVNTSSNILDIISLAGILAALGIDSEDANVVDTDIIEIDIPDVGHHRIDVTFLPNFGGETFLGFGGGLRRVTFCGPIQAVEEMYLQRQNPDDPCLIEQSTDGGINWTEAWRMDNCGDCADDFPTRVVDGIIEETTDGGATWTPIDDDPRFIGVILPPREGGDPKCDAAQSTVDMIEAHFDQLSADIGTGAAITAVVASVIALLAIVVSLGTLTPLIVPLAAACFWAGSAAMDTALTAGVYEALMCLIYCNSEDDGSYTQAGWASLRNDIAIDPDITGLARQLCVDYITLLGSVGLSNAASYNPTAVGDCSECGCPTEWCYEWNFLTDDGDLTATFGAWTLGQGWVGTTAGTGKSIFLTKAMASTEITHVEMDVIYAPRGNVLVKVGGVNTVNSSNVLTGTYSWDGSVTDNDITLNPSSGASQGASVKLIRMLMRGTGSNPFGSDNCI